VTGPFDIARTLVALAARRPVFHSEADFQHALAWQVQLDHRDAEVRLETRPRRGVRLDLLVRLDGVRYGVEVKYLVRRVDAVLVDEVFELPNQSAHDIARYDVCRDIVRCERLLQDGFVDQASVVVLSNDPAYWRPGTRIAPVDEAFRIHEGRVLGGTLAWSASAGAGTVRGREAAHDLIGRYPCRWQDFIRVVDVNGREHLFRHLLVHAEAAEAGRKTPASVAPPTQEAPAPGDPGGLTARQEVLQAARTLHSAGITTFSPQQLIEQARRQGARSADSTLRTHIASYMVANIATEHGGRWPDLIRIDRGLYRLNTA
jgi:hypothetical protein